MGKLYTEITPELKEFIAQQQMFFTATAAAARLRVLPHRESRRDSIFQPRVAAQPLPWDTDVPHIQP
jgi:hypothetical protein